LGAPRIESSIWACTSAGASDALQAAMLAAAVRRARRSVEKSVRIRHPRPAGRQSPTVKVACGARRSLPGRRSRDAACSPEPGEMAVNEPQAELHLEPCRIRALDLAIPAQPAILDRRGAALEQRRGPRLREL